MCGVQYYTSLQLTKQGPFQGSVAFVALDKALESDYLKTFCIGTDLPTKIFTFLSLFILKLFVFVFNYKVIHIYMIL